MEKIKYLVEATDFEVSTLWQKYSGSNTWTHIPEGKMLTIGHLAEFPVCITLSYVKINGELVAFYNPCSRVVDHTMVENWLDEKLKHPEGVRTNATNFHLVLSPIQEAKNKIGG